ncbi:ABC-2 family transporter protein [Candidatus Woesearchaeota archaeon]|nr:ABC-2 family transporter protein [Candidatus Woesearchaeota archaeon]
MIKKYLAQVFVGFKVATRFRFNFLVNILTVPLSVLIYAFLWTAIFSYTGQDLIRGFSLNGMIGYYVVSMIAGLFIWVDIDKWIAEDIRKGYLVVDMLRPMTYLAQCIYFEIGVNFMGIVVNLIPVFLIGFVAFGLQVASLPLFVAFFMSLAFGFLIAFFISFFVGLTAFWFKEIGGLRRVRRALVVFLSGGMIPLTFFPDTAQKVFAYLPFQYIRYTSINIYLGKYGGWNLAFQMLVQLGWVILLYLLVRWTWNTAAKKFSGEGT